MIRRLFAACFALALGAAAPANAQEDVAAFYQGKQLRVIVGSAAGGGYDLFARIVARHIVNHSPGTPAVIVQTQPAACRVVMTNQLVAEAPSAGPVDRSPINAI